MYSSRLPQTRHSLNENSRLLNSNDSRCNISVELPPRNVFSSPIMNVEWNDSLVRMQNRGQASRVSEIHAQNVQAFGDSDLKAANAGLAILAGASLRQSKVAGSMSGELEGAKYMAPLGENR